MSRDEYKKLFSTLGVVYGVDKKGRISREVLEYNGKSLQMYLNVLRDGYLYFACNVAFQGTFDPRLWDPVLRQNMQKKDRDCSSIRGFVPKSGCEQQAFVDMLSKR